MSPRRDTQLAGLSAVLRALADQTRLRIVALLCGGEVCVCHIHEALRVPQPTASRHLAYLRRAGLVETRREGSWVYYSLTKLQDTALRRAVDTVTQCAGHAEAISRDRARLEKVGGPCIPSDQRSGVAAVALTFERSAGAGRPFVRRT
jgi:ArsR family transcriptional regulator